MEKLIPSKALTALREKRDRILAEFQALKESVQKSTKAGTLSRESYTGAFLLLEAEFDKFSSLAHSLEAPEEIPELPSIQKEVLRCYHEFLKLKKEFEKALQKAETSKDEFPEEDDFPEPEEEDPVLVPDEPTLLKDRPKKEDRPRNQGKKKKSSEKIHPPQKRQKSKEAPKKGASPDAEPEPSKPGAAAPAKKHMSDHAYQMARITKNLGGGAYAVIQNGAYQAATRTDNDVIRAALNTQYYISTGAAVAGMAGGMLHSPTKKLKGDAVKQLSPKQMAQYNRYAIQNHRKLKQQIHSLEKELDPVNTITMSRQQRQRTEEKLSQLRSSLADTEKAAKLGRTVGDFQHHRDLDSQVLQAFSQDGRIPKNTRALHELSSQYLKSQNTLLSRRYGNDFWTGSAQTLEKEIRRTMKSADSIKSQIDLMERQGKFLSSQQRQHLMALREEKKALGAAIKDLKSQQQALVDYAYTSAQINNVLSHADKLAQNKALSQNFVRNTLLRPLYDKENNTTVLAYELRALTDPRITRALYKASLSTIHAPYTVLKKAAPKLATKLRYQQDLQKKEKEKKQKEQKEQDRQQKEVQKARSAHPKEEPMPLTEDKEGSKKSKKSRRGDPEKKKNVFKALRKRFQVKDAAKAAHAAHATATSTKALEEFVKAMLSALQKLGCKTILIVAAVILVIILLFGLISTIGEAGMSVIFSPHEGENGKIDLGPYVTVIEQEKRKFTAMRDDLEQGFYEGIEQTETSFNQKYQNPPKYEIVGGEAYKDEYSKINVTFDGPASNDRELIAMMAVRFQQDLEDPDAMRYLQHLASQGRKLLTASDKTYKHQPGCVQVRVQVEDKEPEPKPGDGGGGGGSHVVPGVRSVRKSGGSHVMVPTQPTEPKEPVYEIRRICPGHRELTIHVHVLTLEELFEADTWEGGPSDWEGWTEENREWVGIFLQMDWAEIYTGFRPGGFISINGALPPEEERHIWEALEAMTGNPYAAAGIMGNLHCESRLLSSNLEDQYEGILGYSNETYTAAVDSGSYLNFVNDAAGYGLAQWTYHTRKEGLLNLARSRGVSISDLDMQLSYLESEFRSFGMMGKLQAMASVEEASDYILFNFENPANANSLQPTRAGISSYFYNKYMLGSAAEGDLTQAQMDVIRIATNSGAYGIPARGGYCQAWAAHVYGKAGFPIDNSSCARVSGERYGVSSDFTIVPPGAAVYGYSSSKYGHVGIYVGGGLVYHNVGGVAVDSLADWVRKFNGFCWGWQAGTDLTAQP